MSTHCGKCYGQGHKEENCETISVPPHREPRDPADVFRNPPGKLEMKARLEAMEMVVSCARDVVALWPQFSIRQVHIMGDKIEALKEALELASK
jgi:hypothetical protein